MCILFYFADCFGQLDLEMSKWILDGKDESDLISDSELQGGSPACVD
jgi:hypothetical protein